MANIIVGDDDCRVEEVVRVLNDNTKVIKEWQKLGEYLYAPLNMMEALRNNLLTNKISMNDVTQTLLLDWRLRIEDEATLGALLKIIKSIGDWKHVEAILRDLIIKKAKSWSDLDEHSKETALEAKVAYLGKVQALCLLQESMNKDEFDEFLNTLIIRKHIPKLFKSGVIVSLLPKKNVKSNSQEKQIRSSPSAFALPKSSLMFTQAPATKVVTNKDLGSTPFPVKAVHCPPRLSLSPLFDTIKPKNHNERTVNYSSTLPSSHTHQTKKSELVDTSGSPLDNRTYQIEYFSSDVLGMGSGGTNVYRGKFGQRDVAVKVISKFKDQSEAENEIRVLLQCDKHENIVRYIHSDMTSDGFLMALELCEKFTLADWVDDPNCIPIEIDSLEVLKQATQGLGFLHQPKINIIHRDLKPSNILFLIRGNEAVVKISDFGISRSISPGRNTRTITRFGGTSGWTAAEMLEAESLLSRTRRCQNEEKIPKMTKKIDIFSLGCIYYFVFTEGKHPFGENERLRDYHIETGKNILDYIDAQQYTLRLRCNLSLLKIMISKDSNKRPDMEYILAHPIFWSHKKMIDFIDEVSNFVNKPTPEKEAVCVACVEKLENNYFPKISNGSPNGWFDSLDDVLKPFFIQNYKKHNHKAIMLVRTLRNYKHHYHEKNFESEVKKHIGEMPNEFMIYWLRICPTLINEMRDGFADLRYEPNFKEYF